MGHLGPEGWLGLSDGVRAHLVVDEPEDGLLERREQRLGAGILGREAQVHIDEGFGAVCTPPDSINRVQVQSSDLSRLKSVELSALALLPPFLGRGFRLVARWQPSQDMAEQV